MRTKTIILSAAIGLVGSASLMAQTNVYSLNAVGYVNITLLPKSWAMVGNQLNSTNNTIGALLPNVPDINGNGPYDFIQIDKYNGTGFEVASGDALSWDGVSNFGWDPPVANSFTLNPGEGAFIRNNALTNIVLTFVGQVPQGTNTVSLKAGYNLVASPVPQSGGITSVLGLQPTGVQYPTIPAIGTPVIDGGVGGGDQMFLFNPVTQTYLSYAEDDSSGNGPSYTSGPDNQISMIPWDAPPGEPTPAVGQAFWYSVQQNIALGGGPTNLVWTRVFSVNN